MFFAVFNDNRIDLLIKKAKRGDETAFCNLIGDIEPFVFNLALRMMNGNRQDAEDMTQEAFLRVYRSLSTYKENASFKTWALRICKNVCLDELRRRQSRISDTMEIPETIPDSSSVQDEIIAGERRRVLEKAVDSLEERAKALIVLRDINGMSYKDIADVMDMEIGTVKSAINRSRKKLREILEEQNLI